MGRSRGAAFGTRASSQQSWTNAGAAAAASWATDRTLTLPTGHRWHVEILLDVVAVIAPGEHDERTATRFHVDIYSEEWGFYFCHAGRCSWIRITDQPFIHGRDEFNLLGLTPALRDVGQLLRHLENKHKLRLRRDLALIRTNLAGAEAAVRSWVAGL